MSPALLLSPWPVWNRKQIDVAVFTDASIDLVMKRLEAGR